MKNLPLFLWIYVECERPLKLSLKRTNDILQGAAASAFPLCHTKCK
jgi:hypothetical protein